jgi:hypothetical protein
MKYEWNKASTIVAASVGGSLGLFFILFGSIYGSSDEAHRIEGSHQAKSNKQQQHKLHASQKNQQKQQKAHK